MYIPFNLNHLAKMEMDTITTDNVNKGKSITKSNDTHDTNQSLKFTRKEKRNMTFYIIGLMSFKFAFESIGVSISLFVLNRLNQYNNANTIWSNLVIANGLSQSIGSAMAGGLLNRFLPNRLMASSATLFTLMGISYNFAELVTKGTINNQGFWNPWIIFPIYILMGWCIGILETCRRTIAASIVGTDTNKLKRMDATVHIFYEIGGTSGAFFSTFMIQLLNYVYSTGVVLIFFVISVICYSMIDIKHTITDEKQDKNFHNLTCFSLVKSWFDSLKLGAMIVFSGRKFIWLIPCYILPLVIHRLFENIIFPFYAKYILNDGSFTGTLLAASNFGELLGALLVLRLVNYIRSPIPWIRIDSLMMYLMWTLVYIGDSKNPWISVGTLIPLIIPISFGWAAGDVSLLAHIQSNLSKKNDNNNSYEDKMKLNAVMGFLYTTYTFFITFIANGMGYLFDKYKTNNEPQKGLFYVAGIMMSIIAIIIFISTFIPPKNDWIQNEKEKQSNNNV